MAVVYATFIESGALAKANIRYIQHRRGKDDQRITRQLFSSNGLMERQEAYIMIDEAEQGTYFYRISLNPDPVKEDSKNDLDLKELTRETMRTLEERLGKPIEFVAAIHKDQRRHIHLLALLPENMNKQDLTFFRNELTTKAKSQRRELDKQPDLEYREKEQKREKAHERKQGLELELKH